MFALVIDKIANRMEEQAINIMPRIGDAAPDFEAVTTKGTIKFSDFLGSDLVDGDSIRADI